MNKKIYDVFGKLFNIIADGIKINNDKDILAAKNIIILSQTYYYKDENNKEKDYLQKAMIDHALFKNHQFWDELFSFEMNKEIHRTKKIEEINFEEKWNIDEKRLIDQKKFEKLAFGQIMTLSNNMVDFGITPDEVYKIMEPKIAYFHLTNDLIESIKCVLNLNKENEKDKKKNNKKEEK